jgi:hypothetical protein
MFVDVSEELVALVIWFLRSINLGARIFENDVDTFPWHSREDLSQQNSITSQK